jgi:putative methanogenesis marker protein 2
MVSFGDDSAILKSDDKFILFAADGIWSKLTEHDPVWAGYCAVLANVNDIYAMGGKPLALTNVMSTKSNDGCPKIVKGIADGCKKFMVPMVGGHLHPDTIVETLSISIVGEASAVLTSFDATPGQDIVLAIDITGEQHDGFLNWDSTSMKSSEQVVKRLGRMVEIAERGLATSAKDVSNPGILGTIGMLLETSGVGAEVSIDAIPRPEKVALTDWLRMYPGFGFIMTCDKRNTADILAIFAEEAVACAVIGEVTDTKRMQVTLNGEEATLFDFNSEIITGITKDALPK